MATFCLPDLAKDWKGSRIIASLRVGFSFFGLHAEPLRLYNLASGEGGLASGIYSNRKLF